MSPLSRLVCLKLKDFNKTSLVYDLENQQYLAVRRFAPPGLTFSLIDNPKTAQQ